jgi:hypothetical protein
MRFAVVAALLAACSANDDIPAPQVASITPDQGPANAVVQVDGSYFCQRPEGTLQDPTCPSIAGSVQFGQVPETPVTWQDTAIQVEVPSGVTGSVAVSVTAMGRASNSVSFTVQ